MKLIQIIWNYHFVWQSQGRCRKCWNLAFFVWQRNAAAKISKFFLDKTEEIASGQTVLRDMFQRLATVRLMFHCSHRSNVCVFSFSHPLFGRITGVGPYLGTRACACPIACRSSFTPEPRHLSINQTDGYVFLLFRRLGQDMYVSSSPCHPTAGSQTFTDRCALSTDLWRHTSFSYVQVTSGEIERVSNNAFSFLLWFEYAILFRVQRT